MAKETTTTKKQKEMVHITDFWTWNMLLVRCFLRIFPLQDKVIVTLT